MKTIIKNLHEKIENPALSRNDFIDTLQNNFEELYHLNAEQSKLYDLPISALDEILQLSFQSRQAINKRINNFSSNNKKEDRELLTRVSDMNRALRYLEDYVLEISMRDEATTEKKYLTLHGEGSYFLIAPDQKLEHLDDLKSGDVILSRGSAFTSAAIARIGVNDTQFSHLSFLYRNPEEDGKAYTIEAHIEIGSVIAPIDVHLNQKNSRTVIYRFEDPEMAHQAAEFMYHKVKTQSDKGSNIEYNFSMLCSDVSRLFCSQVIHHGFHEISNKSLDIPKFKTQFNTGLIPFLNRLGVPVSMENIEELVTFSPGDIEYDPRFHLVAEWKDPHQLRDSRLKDAILTKMFAWMDKDNYHIHTPLDIALKSRITWLLRRTPIVKKWLEKKLPLNMNVGQLNVFLTLDKIGAVLSKEVLKVQKTKDHPLSIKEIFEVLEDFRNKDKQSSKPLFHQWLHPREEDY